MEPVPVERKVTDFPTKSPLVKNAESMACRRLLEQSQYAQLHCLSSLLPKNRVAPTSITSPVLESVTTMLPSTLAVISNEILMPESGVSRLFGGASSI